MKKYRRESDKNDDRCADTEIRADKTERGSEKRIKKPRPRTRKFSVFTARAAVIAAVYAGLCYAAIPTSYGVMQLRIAEALTLLPLVMPEAIAGLTVGCLIANIMSAPLDLGIGMLATLFAACATWYIGRTIHKTAPRVVLGVLPPIVFNALSVPVVLLAAGLNVSGSAEFGYWACVGFVALGQTICVIGLGIPLYFGVTRSLYRFRKKRRILPTAPDTPAETEQTGTRVLSDGACVTVRDVEAEKSETVAYCVSTEKPDGGGKKKPGEEKTADPPTREAGRYSEQDAAKHFKNITRREEK